MITCPTCGIEYPPESPQCLRCGTPTPGVSVGRYDASSPETSSNEPASVVLIGPDNSSVRYVIAQTLSLGREGTDVTIADDDRLSRRHLEFRAESGAFVMSDLGSANGTYVKATRAVRIEEGDRIAVNGTWFTFRTS